MKRGADLGERASQLLGVLVVSGYVLLLGYEHFATAPIAGLSDLYVGGTFLGLVIWRRAVADTPEHGRRAELTAFVIAGVAFGYAGLSALTALPVIPSLRTVGELSLVVWGLSFMYRIGFRPETV